MQMVFGVFLHGLFKVMVTDMCQNSIFDRFHPLQGAVVEITAFITCELYTITNLDAWVIN